MKKLDIVVCGGTFDHFHKGHAEFLRFVLSTGKKAIVGLTSQNFIDGNKARCKIQSYEERKESLEKFLIKEKAGERVEITPINDLFGPTLSPNLEIEAIVVSEETKSGAGIINAEREKLGLKLLEVVVTPLIKSKDGQVISSKRIRNGQLNREGRLYLDSFLLTKKLFLSPVLRWELKKPFGFLIKDLKRWMEKDRDVSGSTTVTIGDVATKSFNDFSFGQKISVVDFFVARKRKFSCLEELGFKEEVKVVNSDNPPGFLTPSLFQSALDMMIFLENNKRLVFKINGEEDLAVLPFLLVLPLGFVIFYGQPNEGVVKVEVSEENKEKAYKIVGRFDVVE